MALDNLDNLNNIEKTFHIEIAQENATFIFPCSQGQYRATAQIREGGFPYKDNCDIVIWGVGQEKLRQLTYLVSNPATERNKKNTVKIWVNGSVQGNKIVGGNLAFQGDTYFTSADFTGAPNISLNLTGAIGIWSDTQSAGAEYQITAEQGLTLKQLLEIIKNKLGWGLVKFTGKNAETVANRKIGDYIMSGATWYQRLNNVASDFNLSIRNNNYNIIVAQYGDEFYTEQITVNRDNGLITYPTFTNFGVSFQTIYNNNIKVGNIIKLESIVPLSSNSYKVEEKLTTLSSEPNGQWKSQYTASYWGDKQQSSL